MSFRHRFLFVLFYCTCLITFFNFWWSILSLFIKNLCTYLEFSLFSWGTLDVKWLFLRLDLKFSFSTIVLNLEFVLCFLELTRKVWSLVGTRALANIFHEGDRLFDALFDRDACVTVFPEFFSILFFREKTSSLCSWTLKTKDFTGFLIDWEWFWCMSDDSMG